jgi:hypothetical protein
MAAMEKHLPKDERDGAPSGRVAVPLDVQVEIAKQNQKLAEARYQAAVRRGRAWDTGMKESQEG